ncbi:MarR family transcriptional regulator [Agrococcus jejuensis]|uniref:MarR family protein n=1 Tax=Agrococcus jejuensis TaxID=399736 RepID=A0A1G8FA46_9MICO|nr:MarR family transcriptional regulator [Agrococcus jejuensis]SDH78978.1 MarR family protein [Agrococcus jejuensis]
MPASARTALVERFLADRSALGRVMALERMQPWLDVPLTMAQLRVLLLVAGGVATTGSALATALDVTPATVSTSVDRLVEAGYLRREESADDRRVRHLAPTERGAELHARLADRHEATDEVLDLVADDDLAALVQGFAALRAAIETVAERRRSAERD